MEATIDKLILRFDKLHISDRWGIDQHGNGWGWFDGTIETPCAMCGSKIVHGWCNAIDGVICKEHVDDSAIFNK